MNNVLQILNERAKELNCLYATEELFKNNNEDIETILMKLINIIPAGWQYSTICEARIIIHEKEYKNKEFKISDYVQSADIIVDNNIIGKIQVFYSQFIRNHHNNTQFLAEEQKLLNTIADRLSYYIFFSELKKTIDAIKFPIKNANSEYNIGKIIGAKSDEHWKWRFQISEKIALALDLEHFGVESIYLIGSTKNANAGPNSDIDLMIHFIGNNTQKNELKAWINGWSLCLSQYNFIKTGYYQEGGLIDLHIITQKEIDEKDSFAIMINSTENRARLLRTKIN